jgi:pilus assembly protein Flp/PilA
MRHLKRLFRDDAGTAAVEYGLVLALIFLAVIGAIGGLGNSTTASFNSTAGKVAAASG